VAAAVVDTFTAAMASYTDGAVQRSSRPLGRSTRWLLMHHVGHRGYDKVPGVPAKYTSKVFARGWRAWSTGPTG
jgi:hypothetical protein